jgi:hypothetical protein
MHRTVLPGFSDRISAFLSQAAVMARQQIPHFHPNVYCELVDCVVQFTTADSRYALLRNKKTQVTLEFLSRLEGESHEIDSRLNVLALTLEHLQIDSEALQTSSTTRKEAIEFRRAKLDEEYRTKLAEVTRLDEDAK